MSLLFSRIVVYSAVPKTYPPVLLSTAYNAPNTGELIRKSTLVLILKGLIVAGP